MSLWTELKRRNIFRVAAAYVVIGWLTLQVADIVLGFTGAPEWVGKALIAMLLLGIIPVLALAWVFEVGPDGIRVDDGSAQRDASPQARRLDVVTLGAVVLVMLLMVGQQLAPALLNPEAAETTQPTASTAPTAQPEPRPIPGDDLTAPEGSIAVLPFTNRSPDPDTGYFVDGIHDDLLTELARNPQLTVISRTSVMEYRNTTKNLRQIGEELGVANVLEGAVQRSGQRVRINAQLIDAETDAHLWADTFDRELSPESVFDIQSEIATAIAGALGRTLGTSQASVGAVAGTSNTEAFDLYLRARSSSETNSDEQIRGRIALYREALDKDSEFLLAMGELGREYTNLYWYVTRRDEDRQRGDEWIARALRAAPDNSQLQLANAEHLYRANLDYEGALAALERAEIGLPGDARIFKLRAYVLRRSGDLNGTLEALETAALLDPRSTEILGTLIETHWLRGDLETTRRWHERALALPDDASGVTLMMASAELQIVGNAEAAIEVLDELDPDESFTTQFFGPIDRFRYALLAREFERASTELERMAETTVLFEDQFYVIPIDLLRAELAEASGDRAGQRRHAGEALAILDGVVERHPTDYRAWSQRAIALALLDRPDEAMESADRALDQDIPRRDALIRSEMERFRLFALALSSDTAELVPAMDAYLSSDLRYWGVAGLLRYPAFDRHVDDPDFQAMVARHAREDAVQ